MENENKPKLDQPKIEAPKAPEAPKVSNPSPKAPAAPKSPSPVSDKPAAAPKAPANKPVKNAMPKANAENKVKSMGFGEAVVKGALKGASEGGGLISAPFKAASAGVNTIEKVSNNLNKSSENAKPFKQKVANPAPETPNPVSNKPVNINPPTNKPVENATPKVGLENKVKTMGFDSGVKTDGYTEEELNERFKRENEAIAKYKAMGFDSATAQKKANVEVNYDGDFDKNYPQPGQPDYIPSWLQEMRNKNNNNVSKEEQPKAEGFDYDSLSKSLDSGEFVNLDAGLLPYEYGYQTNGYEDLAVDARKNQDGKYEVYMYLETENGPVNEPDENEPNYVFDTFDELKAFIENGYKMQ